MASTQPSKTFKITVAAVIIAGAIAWLETRPGEGAEAAKKITAQAENNPRSPIQPAADIGQQRLLPEMTIRFTKGTYACLTRDALQEFMAHGAIGEATKLNAMVNSKTNPTGPCFFIDPSQVVKVVHVEYNIPDNADLGLLEIVGTGSQSSNGAWALSVGAEPAP